MAKGLMGISLEEIVSQPNIHIKKKKKKKGKARRKASQSKQSSSATNRLLSESGSHITTESGSPISWG